MNVNKTLQKVLDYINREMAKYPEITPDKLDGNGTIYYRNGNDGTNWD